MGAKVIMLASGKGGTGKSTVSVMLGGALAARGERVLLVELDSGLRSVDLISGVYGKTVYDIEDVLSGRCSAEKAVVESPLYSDLYVISAPYSGGTVRPSALAAFISTVGEAFEYILLDTAAGMGAPFISALSVAQLALIVVTPDPITVRDGRIVADTIAEKGRANLRLILNKVPTMLDGTGIANLDECIDTVSARLIGVIPQSDDIMRAAVNGSRIPAKSKAAKAFNAVAARLCGRETPLVIK